MKKFLGLFLVVVLFVSCYPTIGTDKVLKGVEGNMMSFKKVGEYKNYDLLEIRLSTGNAPLYVFEERVSGELTGVLDATSGKNKTPVNVLVVNKDSRIKELIMELNSLLE